DPYEAREVYGLTHNQSTRFQRRWQVRRRLQPPSVGNAASKLKSADFLSAERGSLQSFHARSLHPPPHCVPNIFPQCQIASLTAAYAPAKKLMNRSGLRSEPVRAAAPAACLPSG